MLAPMPTEALNFRNVTKRYPHQLALNDLNLSVQAGEFFGLVGVNGAGKTTLIKSLLDFCDIDSGLVEIFGTDHRQAPARARLAYLPERFLPPYYLTGRDFLQFMARLHRIKVDDTQTTQMLATLDLDSSALTKPVRDYSKGMAQKLGLAACFLSGKDLLVLDEPMSGLDPKARALLKTYLQQLKAQGKTLFFSTHMLHDVESLCDRIAILHGGNVRFVGSPQQCCAQFNAGNLEQAYLNCIGV